MKNNAFLTVFIAFIASTFLFSCSKHQNEQIPKEVMEEICPTCKAEKFWLPEGSTIEYNLEKDATEIVITAPEGYLYYGLAADSSLITWKEKESGGNTVTVTCKCTDGDAEKCNPVGNDGSVKCVISPGCNSCDRIEKAKSQVTKQEYEILTGGFVNPGIGVTFAEPNEELPYAFEALLEYPEVKAQLESFMLQFYDNLSDIPSLNINETSISAPSGYKFVILNVYGRALTILLPESKDITSAGGYHYTCPCNGTSGVCKVKNKFGYYFCTKPDSNPCNKACNTMTIEDDITNTIYSYTFYYF
ncbi:MAG: hypothetical protein Kow00127_13510 [Bacteroidales bacterium]